MTAWKSRKIIRLKGEGVSGRTPASYIVKRKPATSPAYGVAWSSQAPMLVQSFVLFRIEEKLTPSTVVSEQRKG